MVHTYWKRGLKAGFWGDAGMAHDRLAETAVNEDAPIHAEWKTHAGEVRHTFTHFHLKLR